MSKRKFAISFLMLLTALLSTANVALGQDQKSIRFATYNSDFVNAVNDMLVKNFNKLHPDIKVNVEYIASNPAIEQQFASQAAAKNLADVVFLADLYVVPFAKGNIVMDM